MKAFIEHMRSNNGNVVKNQFINYLNNKKSISKLRYNNCYC